MDKKYIHTNSNELKMREGFPPFFNCCLTFHFKSVYYKLWHNETEGQVHVSKNHPQSQLPLFFFVCFI